MLCMQVKFLGHDASFASAEIFFVAGNEIQQYYFCTYNSMEQDGALVLVLVLIVGVPVWFSSM